MVIIVDEMTQEEYDCILCKLGKNTEIGRFFSSCTTTVLDTYRFAIDVGNRQDVAEMIRDTAINCGVRNAYIT